MRKIEDFPRELTEAVLSRLPVTSLRVARFTCKNWNMISKDRSFTKKHFREAAKAAAKRKHEFQMVMILEHRIYLVNINLLNPSIDRIGKLISLDNADRVEISKIFHCEGLILCITKDRSRLVVWNHYSGQTRWIEPRNSFHYMDRFAIGYEKKSNSVRSHKILRYMEYYDTNIGGLVRGFEIFDLNSNLWKVVDVNTDCRVEYCRHSLTLKGNSYWLAQEKFPSPRAIADLSDFLICFNFTTERFEQRLPLPIESTRFIAVSLSSVRDEQLALLYQRARGEYTVKIWISNKIEPNAVSWRELFLTVDMKPLIGSSFCKKSGSFFVDEKKKVAIILHKETIACITRSRLIAKNIACIIGKKGYFRKLDLGESLDHSCWPLLCSYFPSSDQIMQALPHRN